MVLSRLPQYFVAQAEAWRLTDYELLNLLLNSRKNTVALYSILDMYGEDR